MAAARRHRITWTILSLVTDKRFRWALRGEVDLISLVDEISPISCRPFVVPSNLRQSKASIVAPDTMTNAAAHRPFLAAIETMGLTVEPEGKVLKIIEANRARSIAIPVFGISTRACIQRRERYRNRLSERL